MKLLKSVFPVLILLLTLSFTANAQKTFSKRDQAKIKKIIGPEYDVKFEGLNARIFEKKVRTKIRFSDLKVGSKVKRTSDVGLIIFSTCESNCGGSNGNGNSNGNGTGNGNGNGNSNGNGSGNSTGNSNGNGNGNTSGSTSMVDRLSGQKQMRLKAIVQKYDIKTIQVEGMGRNTMPATRIQKIRKF